MRALMVVAAVLAAPAFALDDEACADPPMVAAVVLAPPGEQPLLALKALGGVSGVTNSSEARTDQAGFSGMLGIEYRIFDWLALRSDFDFRRNGLSWDAAGLKLSAPWFLSPYVSVAATIGLSGPLSFGPVGAAGFDLHFGRHFFVEVEGAYRVAPGETLRQAGQVSVMGGLGYAFL